MSKEIKKDLKTTNKEIAQQYAEANGHSSIKELTDKANAMMESHDTTQRALGRAFAQKTVLELLQLCLRQEIIDTPLPNYMNITERVFDGYLTEGNSKEYIADLDTGTTTWLNTEFIPAEHTKQQLEDWFIQIYTRDNAGAHKLSDQAYQFKKEQTIPMNEWIPFFKSGKLNEYITKKQASLNRAYKIFLYNKLCEIIVDQGKGKIVNGQAGNLYEAVLEISGMIERMYQYNGEYNAEQDSKVMYAPNPDDILIFCSNNVRSQIINGIAANTFNAEMLGTSKKTISYEALKTLGNKITQGDQSTINEDTKQEWIDDETIIVLDISRIRHIIQVDLSSAQYFAKNLTNYISKDVWGAMDILPWCKKLIYKNGNLRSVPNVITK